jgi:hydroxymethylbilane synthase
MKKIRIGTRGSRLALVQSEQVRDFLQKNNPGSHFELVIIKTTGDRILDAPLSKIGDKGLFTKEIENELLAGSIDLAVHSMKDMPTALPTGLKVGAVTARLDPRDVFISKSGDGLRALKHGATIATGSLRRKSQLLAFNPGLKIIDIRGNVESRLKKMEQNPSIDGIILAGAGLTRLDLANVITEIVPEEIIIPAVGQASLAIEVRDNDPAVEAIIASLDDRDSRIAIECERSFLAALGGGCQVPIAGRAYAMGDTVKLVGMVSDLEGREVFHGVTKGPVSDHRQIGIRLARKLLDDGAKKILEEIYGHSIL